MKRTTALIIGGVLAFIAGAYVTDRQNVDCVTVYVDYGPLGSGTKSTACIPANGKINAIDLLSNAGIKLEGTQKYGNAVVCRVNELPDSSMEQCLDMPPAEAYWAVLVKDYEIIPFPFDTAGEWGWAQTGINEIYLNPGDSIGLVFANEGEVKFP